MKVLHICETAQGGVAGCFDIHAAYAPSGVENVVLLPDSHARDLQHARRVRGYVSGQRGVGQIWRMVKAMRAAIRAERPEVLFFHSSFALLALIAARLTGWRGPAVYCAHGWAAGRYEQPDQIWARVIRLIEGQLCGLANATLNIGPADAQLARLHRYRGRHLWIDNATSPPRKGARRDLFDGGPNDVNLLFVGRFDHQKGLDILLPAFAAARRLRPELHLHIVGDSVRKGRCLPPLPEGTTLHGWISPRDIDDFYASADAVVLPSRWEGLPLVIPEALRNGTPVLCSRRSQLPELIEEGLSGSSFELGVAPLTACLITLDKADLRARRGAAMATYRARFTVERWRQKIAGFYTQVMQGAAVQ